MKFVFGMIPDFGAIDVPNTTFCYHELAVIDSAAGAICIITDKHCYRHSNYDFQIYEKSRPFSILR